MTMNLATPITAQARPCRGCGVMLLWRYTRAGKIMPLNANLLLTYEQGCYVIEGVHCRPALPLLDDGAYYRPHWADCPSAAAFRVRADD